MNDTNPKRALIAAAGLALATAAGCSLMYEYDPEGQPCNAKNECLEGFVCSKTEGCIRPDAGAAPAKRDASSGADAD